YRQARPFMTSRSPLEGIRLTELGEANGWMVSEGRAWDTPQRKEKVVAESKRGFFPLLQLFRIDPRADRATRAVLDTCRARGIPVLLLLMPEDSEFRSWYTRQGEERLQAYLGELKQTYGVRVTDARAWLGDDVFFDSHHLNLSGARKLSD